ncbi:unnamed protein product [Pieris brassicae]|uniref:Uncharacterized protein n=1 Tax=Pieris brassicae TaxID=7116 RepID=A0A9P0TXB1_PIEBR|nr:unnamed protein product [Pieris brassicae]
MAIAGKQSTEKIISVIMISPSTFPSHVFSKYFRRSEPPRSPRTPHSNVLLPVCTSVRLSDRFLPVRH